MSNHYPPAPPPPKALRRSRSNRFIGGVCGGLADYLNMDATLVRILTVVISLFTGVPIILYLVALFLMPEEDRPPAGAVPPPPPGYAPYPSTYPSVPQQAPADEVWGPAGPPWAAGSSSATPEPFPPAPADPPRRQEPTV